MLLTVILFLFQAVSDRTPHLATSPTPFGGNDYGSPSIWWGVIGVAVVILLLGLMIGFRNPFAKKKPNPYVHEVKK